MYIKSSWKEINFEEFIKLQKIEIDNKQPLRIWAERLAIITNKTTEEILNLPIDIFKLYIFQAAFLNDRITESINQFTIDKTVYTLPNEFGNLTGGQFGEAEHFLKHKGVYESIPFLIAIVVQDSKNYDGNKALELSEKIKMLDAETLIKISNFFLSKEKNSLIDSLQFSKIQLMNQLQETVQTYKTITVRGGGIRNFLKRLQITIYYKWVMRQIYKLGKS